MIDFSNLDIEGVFPPVGKRLSVAHPSGHTSQSFTADTYRLFGDGADYRLHLKNTKEGRQVLNLQFCPLKILQGHNGLGSNDLRGVVRYAVEKIFVDQGIPFTKEVKRQLKEGGYRLREVHIAELHRMPHEAIPALCSAIRRYAPDSLEAVPLQKGIGVRLWPHSDSRQVLIYDKVHFFNDAPKSRPLKHLDILRAGINPGSWAYHGQVFNFEELLTYLQQRVRIEVRLKAPFLKKRGLDVGGAWTPEVARQQHAAVLKEIPLADQPLASTVDLAIGQAPHSQKALIALWSAGREAQQFATSRAAFYRHRLAILKRFGIDISLPFAKLPSAMTWPTLIAAGSIVMDAPTWAKGDGFYFDPKRPHVSVQRKK